MKWFYEETIIKSIAVAPPAEIDRFRILFMVMMLLVLCRSLYQVSPDFGGK